MRILTKARRVVPLAVLVAAGCIPSAAHADHNYNCQGAHAIPTSVPWTGTVSSTDYDDWYYHYAILPVHTYTLSMTGGDADLEVWSGCPDTGGTRLCRSAMAGTATDSCTVVGTGVHNIQVSYWSGGSVLYRLDVSNP